MTARDVFDRLGLTDYEQDALINLFDLGRTTAPNLAAATGIPKARIYGVLDSLAGDGYVEVIPGRPKEYIAKPPNTVLDRATENERQSFEQFKQEIERNRESFLSEFQPRYEHATEGDRPAEELFRVVDVGEPSESGTRRIYHTATETVRVLSKAFEYLDRIEPAFANAVERGLDVRILLLSPDRLAPPARAQQADTVAHITDAYPSVGIRYSDRPLPWRGTIADPSMEYNSGTAILLVQEDEVPNHMRQAAITENGSFVAGVSRYFELVWTHESDEVEENHANTP
ncbi:TrmB family transcriptional regulator [Halocatena pleomorpha]|uniref:TrmB family transcriptional regulator n=1 Tax=Halocatena pleomorpha TaxID=1785090 RepID=A0A3P3R8R4_9EURY|nr:helix-turn-helix domain-containing protein [Halocatena pleomorpha]RRJ29862.1 TrmB family transcriptional regulator [Halocatena pleomorpha]